MSCLTHTYIHEHTHTHTHTHTGYIPTCQRSRDDRSPHGHLVLSHVNTHTHTHIYTLVSLSHFTLKPTSLVLSLSHNPSPNCRTIPACTSAAPHASASVHQHTRTHTHTHTHTRVQIKTRTETQPSVCDSAE